MNHDHGPPIHGIFHAMAMPKASSKNAGLEMDRPLKFRLKTSAKGA
ncbi:hypothetical protein F0726_01219 [Acidithiobacillus caldus]|nr:hypothetical protein F0726_01219 [Acidithiobacillus caldus]